MRGSGHRPTGALPQRWALPLVVLAGALSVSNGFLAAPRSLRRVIGRPVGYPSSSSSSSPSFSSSPSPYNKASTAVVTGTRVTTATITAATTTAAASSSSSSASSSSSPLSELFSPAPGEGDGARFVFVGGKGGVGKTTTTAALAVSLADAGFRTLVVSTDPAHSLGDALMMPLSGTGGAAVPVPGCTGPDGTESLDALEIDPAAALADLTEALSAFDLRGAAMEVGGQGAVDLVEKLGLSDFVAILENPPPGIDELVALSEVLRLAKPRGDGDDNGGDGDGKKNGYDRVLIDTAPTGHTLRLLAAPDFLDGFLGKLGALRGRLDGILGLGAGFLGLDLAALTGKLDTAVEKIERYQEQMRELKALLRDPSATEFVAVAAPTALAVDETRRLVKTLGEEGIPIRHLVVNRVIGGGGGEKAQTDDAPQDDAAATEDAAVLATIRRGQAAALRRAKDPSSVLSGASLKVTQVPFFDAEIGGSVPGLRYMGAVAFQGKYETMDLLDEGAGDNAESYAEAAAAATAATWEGLVAPDQDDRRFVVVGGKGGVGKTSTSAALAVACAEQGGYNTVVVSTDPAHSLGDALGLTLMPGVLTPVPDADTDGVMGGQPGGSLYALEVDPSGAVDKFRELVRSFADSGGGGGGGGGGGDGLMSQLNLGDFADVLDTPPPGLDELVALSEVLNLVQQQQQPSSSSSAGGGGGGDRPTFDRVIIDTAPTGHTLRLLAFPRFIDDFLERLIALRAKFKGATAMLSMFSGGGGGGGGGGGASDGDDDEAAAEAARDRLREFQVKMYALEDMLQDQETTEFCVVTLPTELAMAESERLVTALGKEGIAVRNVVVNQVLRGGDAGALAYVGGLRKGQGRCIKALREIAAQGGGGGGGAGQGALSVTEVPWLDVEARSVYGLRAVGQCLL